MSVYFSEWNAPVVRTKHGCDDLVRFLMASLLMAASSVQAAPLQIETIFFGEDLGPGYSLALSASINERGDVSFGIRESGTQEVSIYVSDAETGQISYRHTTPVGSPLAVQEINDAGDIAYSNGESIDGVVMINDQVVVQVGDVVPGMVDGAGLPLSFTHVSSLYDAGFSNEGALPVHATLSDGRSGIWRYTDQSLVPVVLQGDMTPDGQRVEYASHSAMNNNGDRVFATKLVASA